MSNEYQIAPLGMVWQCPRCGSRSIDRLGIRKLDADYGKHCAFYAEMVNEAEAMTQAERDRAVGQVRAADSAREQQ